MKSPAESLSRKDFLLKSVALGAVLIPGAGFLTACAGSSPTPSPSPAPVPGAPISPSILAIIQTAATIATGAVLDFAVSQAASKTQLANQIYSAASALYEASGGTVALTPTALNTLLASFAITGVSQYTSFVTAIESIYNTYFAQYVTGLGGVQNFQSIVAAIAQGAEAGAQAYETVSTTASS